MNGFNCILCLWIPQVNDVLGKTTFLLSVLNLPQINIFGWPLITELCLLKEYRGLVSMAQILSRKLQNLGQQFRPLSSFSDLYSRAAFQFLICQNGHCYNFPTWTGGRPVLTTPSSTIIRKLFFFNLHFQYHSGFLKFSSCPVSPTVLHTVEFIIE